MTGRGLLGWWRSLTAMPFDVDEANRRRAAFKQWFEETFAEYQRLYPAELVEIPPRMIKR